MEHQGTIELRTDRLVLRRFRADDAEAMFANWASDVRVTEFLPWPAHADVEVTRKVLAEWIANYETQSFYQWGIEIDGALVGSISVVGVDESSDAVEIGYALGAGWWGQGIMSEALVAVRDFMFSKVKCNRVWLRCAAENEGSAHVALNAGLAYEGTLRQSNRRAGGFWDMKVFALLAEDWRALNP